jgi:hypothetical protein
MSFVGCLSTNNIVMKNASYIISWKELKLLEFFQNWAIRLCSNALVLVHSAGTWKSYLKIMLLWSGLCVIFQVIIQQLWNTWYLYGCWPSTFSLTVWWELSLMQLLFIHWQLLSIIILSRCLNWIDLGIHHQCELEAVFVINCWHYSFRQQRSVIHVHNWSDVFQKLLWAIFMVNILQMI